MTVGHSSPGDGSTRFSPRAGVAVASAGLLLLLWALYRVAFGAPFYLDTLRTLVFRTNLHVTELTWRSLDDAVRLDYGRQVYRPLSQLSFALTHYFSGLDPVPYRLGNVVIHWGASLALLFLFLSVLRSPRVEEHHPALRRNSLGLSLAAVALWSLHPIQTNAVTYVVQRMTSLSGLFTFLAVGAYLRVRSSEGRWSPAWSILSLTALGLAMASKESAVVVLPLLAAAEFVLLRPPAPGRARRLLAVSAVAAAALCAGLALWQGPAHWKFLVDLAETRQFSMWERLLTQARIQANYLMVLLIPDPRLLTLDAEVAVSRSLVEPPSTALMMVAVGTALALAVRFRRTRPLLAFGVFWFFLSQLAEGTILPLELYFEHRMYVPSAFLFLGLAAGASSVLAGVPRRRAVVAAVLTTVLAVEACATYSRNSLWARPIAFHLDNAAKAPNKARPHLNLGYFFRLGGFYEEAKKEFLTSLALGGDKPENYVNLAAVAYAQKDFAATRGYLHKATEARPKEGGRWEPEWAMLELAEGNLEAALQRARKALRQEPGNASAWFLLGEILGRLGRGDDAEKAYEACLRFDPARADAWHRLGLARRGRGDSARALTALEKAASLEPTNAEYRKDFAETAGR